MSALTRDTAYVIWSRKHALWWSANRCGYDRALRNAGVYTQADAEQIAQDSTYGPENEWSIARPLLACWHEGEALNATRPNTVGALVERLVADDDTW